MRNEIVNPLFESLVKRAEGYVHPSVSEAGVSLDKGLGFAAYNRTIITIVKGLISDFSYAINTYPATKIQREFKSTFKTNLAAIGNKINTVKTAELQTSEVVLPGIEAEYTRFKNSISKETEYDPKMFEQWIGLFDKMMNARKSAISDIIKKMGEISTVEDKGSLPDVIRLSLQKYIESFSNEIKIVESAYVENEYNSDRVLEHLSNSNVCVDFKTYSKIVNEGIFDFIIGSKKDRQANRGRKDLITKTETLKARLDSVMARIAASRNDASEKSLKALDKEATFNNIYKRINSIEGKYGEGVDPKGINWDEETKRLNAVTMLFNNELQEFEDLYKDEVEGTQDYANVLIAIPTLKDHLDRAEGAKNSLSTESLNVQNNYKIKLSADAAAAAEAAKKKKEEEKPEEEKPGKSEFQIKEPIKRGSKDKDNIKKFQKLTIDKMKGLKGKSKEYDKFAKYGADGIFGKSTDAFIKFLKKGFKIKDTSSDITQELIDKISSDDGKINDSYSYPYSLHEEFDLKAARGESSEDGPKATTKEDVKTAKSALKGNAKEIMKSAPKLSADTVKKEIDSAVAKAKEEWSKDQAVKELKEIGAKENPDYGKNGQMAVATATGIRFYSNGVALRLFDKKMGTYSVKNDEFKGDDGSKDKLSILMKSGIPSKYAVAFGKFNSDPAKACKDCLSWSNDTITILNSAFKITYNKSLDKYLAGKLSTWYSGVNDDVDKFRKKFASVLS